VTVSHQSQKEIVIHDFIIDRLESKWLERFLPVNCVWEFRTLVQVLTSLIIFRALPPSLHADVGIVL
jgi:hypothetical protein